jgi:hypothetical protein
MTVRWKAVKRLLPRVRRRAAGLRRRVRRLAAGLRRRVRRLAIGLPRQTIRLVSPMLDRIAAAVAMMPRPSRPTCVYVLLSAGSESVSSRATRTIRAAATARIPVEVHLLDLDPTAVDAQARGLAGIAPEAVARCFWREAAPAGVGAAPRQSTMGLTPGPIPGPVPGTWQTGYFQIGRPVLSIIESGEATFVDHYDMHGRPMQRDEIDSAGALVRIVDLHPVTGLDATYRYLDANGRCWLSVWVTPSGEPGPAQQYWPAPREFPSLRSAQAEWVREQIVGAVRPKIIAIGAAAEDVETLVNRRGAANGASRSRHRTSPGASSRAAAP